MNKIITETCSSCIHDGNEDGQCDDCSRITDEECSCHINPPCSYCEHNHYEEEG